nr:hypothetical protein [Tanacetum cinerariifolium]
QMVLRFCWGSSEGGGTSLSKGFWGEKGKDKGGLVLAGNTVDAIVV